MIKKWERIHLSSFMLLSGIDGLPDYWMGESADVEDWLTEERKAELSAFSPCQTIALYSEVYRSFSFNLKKRFFCILLIWILLYISLVLTLWTYVNNVW